MTRDAVLTGLPGIGPKTAAEFAKAGIVTVGDLLDTVPVSYEMPEAPVPIDELREGETAAVRAEICSAPVTRSFGGRTVTSCRAADGTGELTVYYFSMPYIRSSLPAGGERIFRGRVSRGKQGWQMAHPSLWKPEEYDRVAGKILPVYDPPGRFGQTRMRKLMREALARTEASPSVLPKSSLQVLSPEAAAMDPLRALAALHFPAGRKELAAARERLVFEEFLLFLLKLRLLKQTAAQAGNACPMPERSMTDRVRERLPYALTAAQDRVLAEILRDMAGDHGMNRLIQGDVGSGKTVLAFLAMTAAYENGYQAAMMAPTEVLARQHFEKLESLIRENGLPMRAVLLTGSLRAPEKREIRRRIREREEADLIIGTHALIQEGVAFGKLGLVITDEQHRFGVRQREVLAELGAEPHVLVMSATPIPRTLAMILYGDMDVSVLDELPAGRQPIETAVITPAARRSAVRLMAKEAEAGRQSYVICPQIEPSEESDQMNVLEYAALLRKTLPGIPVGILHGKMKPAVKEEVMEAFLRKEILILVSTTVVEVGVDVPNATVMMVENAECFGLAQLHQLRGRVGRGRERSYCLLVDGSGKKEKNPRLKVLTESRDGFAIAEADLKLRGPGDFFGVRQSGELNFPLGDIYSDAELLYKASGEASRLLRLPGFRDGEETWLLREKLAEQKVIF